MHARDNDFSLTNMLLDDYCCGFTGADSVRLMFRKYPITFDRDRIVIIKDGPCVGFCRKRNAPRVAVMPVHDD